MNSGANQAKADAAAAWARKSVVRWAVAVFALASIVEFYRRLAHVNPTTVALTLLMLILTLASQWGLRYAVVVAVAATCSYNYFFLPPIGTFTIVDPQNWLALLVFLSTAVIASRLSARAQEDAMEARRGQLEVEVLYRLSRELLQTENVAELLHSAPQTIAHVSGAACALLYLADGDRTYTDGTAEAEEFTHGQMQQLVALARVTTLEDGTVAAPLRSGVRPRGVLVLRGLALSEATLEAMAGLVSISIDRAQALEEVTRSEAAKASERLRGMMLDSVTHELRTPLTAIKASATTLLSDVKMPEEDRRDLLMVINEESDRLNHLVAQSVEMAQLDTHDVHMNLSPQLVEVLVDQALGVSSNVLGARHVECSLGSSLPLVQADPVWMQKVFCNLLENAAKYSAAGEPIAVSAAMETAGYVSIKVTDHGIGIDPAEHRLIFDKFYRGRSRPQHVPGTGMGLAICRSILDAHGGSIHVQSSPGQGSEFTVKLPVAADQSRLRRMAGARSLSTRQ